MELEEFAKYLFFQNVTIPVLQDYKPEDYYLPLIGKWFSTYISHQHFVEWGGSKELLIEVEINKLIHELEKQNAKIVEDFTFAARNNIPTKTYRFEVHALCANEALSEGGVFYIVEEYPNVKFINRSKNENYYQKII